MYFDGKRNKVLGYSDGKLVETVDENISVVSFSSQIGSTPEYIGYTEKGTGVPVGLASTVLNYCDSKNIGSDNVRVDSNADL